MIHTPGATGYEEDTSKENVRYQKYSISLGNSSVSYLPENGGHIDSCIIDGVELLYHRFGDDQKKPKGGMPYMFPNAGPLTPEEQKESGLNLSQHGFGRLSEWKQLQEGIQGYEFQKTDEFPYQGRVIQQIQGEDRENAIVFHQYVENLGDDNMPLSSGLHPYFVIPEGDKSAIEWRFVGGEQVKNDIDTWCTGGTGMYDVPKDRRIIFHIPGMGELTLEVTPEYTKFWVWSLPGKNFVCVEPVMGHSGKIATDPVVVPPGGVNHNWMKISLKK